MVFPGFGPCLQCLKGSFQEDGTLRGRQWPSQPVAFKPVKERLLAKRLERFLDRLAERMKPSARSRGFL